MNCDQCKKAIIKTNYKFCPNCGSKIDIVKVLIEHYFWRGYTYKSIVEFLVKYHNVKICLRSLKSKLHLYNLKRKMVDIDEDAVTQAILKKMNSSTCMLGYRSMWHALKIDGYSVSRSIVARLMKQLDPEGCELRKARRLRRRNYCSPGPNFCWHIDGYDKLKPYGFALHGCIDGWSRKILWLKVLRSNNNPVIIGNLYFNKVVELGGYPHKVRSDCGTENGLVATMQCYFCNDENGHIYGTSPHNQRIEAWWSILRRTSTTWWMNFFKDLIAQQDFTPGNKMQEECLWFCFSTLLQSEIDDVVQRWNSHYIRKSGYETVAGRPDELYYLPHLHDGENKLAMMLNSQYEHVTQNLPESCDDNSIYQRYFADVLESANGISLPKDWDSALNLYKNLLKVAC